MVMILKLPCFVGPSVAIVLGLFCMAGCSKEKEEVPIEAAPKTEAPTVEFKEPAATVDDKSKPSAAADSAPAGAVAFVGRLESFVRMASRSLWQIVKTTSEPQQYALITPKADSGDLSKLVTAGGPENVALGISDGPVRTADGTAVVEGKDYRFTLKPSSSDGVWTVEISPAP